MKWPQKIEDQLKLMDNLDYLFKMKLESGCTKEKASKWVKEMVEIYGKGGEDG